MVKNRLLILGLDGATFDLIMPWIESGELPTLKFIKDKGVFGILSCVVPPLSGAAWTSFATGKNPGEHGVLSFLEDPFGNPPRIINSNSVKEKRIWAYLDEHNMKSAVISLPLTYPLQKINGVMVSCFLTPPNAGDFVYPISYLPKLREIGYNIDEEFKDTIERKKRTKDELNKIFDIQVNIIKKRAEFGKYILDNNDYDYFFILFRETDIIQHFFWEQKTILLKFFKKIDELLLDFIDIYKKKYNDNFNVFIMSDHGHGPSPKKSFNMLYWLSQNDYLPKQNNLNTIIPRYMKKIDSLLRKNRISLEKIIPFSVNLFRKFSNNEIKDNKTNNFINKIKICPLGISFTDEIKKNKDDYENLKSNLLSDLKAIKDEQGICPLYLVAPKEKIYQGKAMGNIPDIVYLPDEKYHLNFDIFNNAIFSSYNSYLEGYHGHGQSLNAIFLAMGKDIKHISEELKDLNILDITPTALTLLGFDVSGCFDGKILKNIFITDFSKKDFIPLKKNNSEINAINDAIKNLKI